MRLSFLPHKCRAENVISLTAARIASKMNLAVSDWTVGRPSPHSGSEFDMLNQFREVDRILRGEKTNLPALQSGRIDIQPLRLVVVLIILGIVYGACMGSFAVFRGDNASIMQLIASTVKVPILFLLTFLITFPSLYVFNSLVGSRLRGDQIVSLFVASQAVTLALLASFGPIVAFFSVSTTSYPFMILLNVVVFAVCGFLGLRFLMQTLHRITVVKKALVVNTTDDAETPDDASESPSDGPTKLSDADFGPLDELAEHMPDDQVKIVFRCWVVVFGLVGAQMGWVLRPFVGNPDIEFDWFRQRESNFFEAVINTIEQLFSR